jgi:hypothetical protein
MMNAITIDTTDQKYLISIDRSLMDKPTFWAFFERLRTEALADQMNTDEADLLALSEEVKANWWAVNGEKILNKIAAYTPSAND